MPNIKETRLKFVESCPRCRAYFPDSLIRIPQMTEAANRLSAYLDALLYRSGADTGYLKKQFGEPVENAIADMLHAAVCPDCQHQTDGPLREVKAAAAVMQKLLVQTESLAKRLSGNS